MNARAILMARAGDATDPTALALAGVLAAAYERHGAQVLPLPGLSAAQTRQMLARWFPGADLALQLAWADPACARRAEPRLDEIEDLVALLKDHADPAAGPAGDMNCVAHALACASLGDNHLWQDLFLPSRRELSALIERWFPRLAAKNSHDMKWKKFLYKQLCEREELFICRAPSCSVCTDHAVCFGPE